MKRNRKQVQHESHSKMMLTLAAGVVLLLAVFYWASPGDHPASQPKEAIRTDSSPTPDAEPRVPPFHASVEAARPLPQTLPPQWFRSPLVAQAYRTAGRIPEILVQQPCYCYCDRFGHGSLLDCFATDHGST